MPLVTHAGCWTLQGKALRSGVGSLLQKFMTRWEKQHARHSCPFWLQGLHQMSVGVARGPREGHSGPQAQHLGGQDLPLHPSLTLRLQGLASMENGRKRERSREGAFGVHGLGVDAVVLQTSCALSLSLISSCMRRADRAFPGICSSARQCRCSAATQRAHRLLEPRPPRASS